MKPLILPWCLSSVGNDLPSTQDELGEQLSYNNSFRISFFRGHSIIGFEGKFGGRKAKAVSSMVTASVGTNSSSPTAHY